MSTNNHYDVIVIGTSAGGGTLAYRLGQSGKKILVSDAEVSAVRPVMDQDNVTLLTEAKVLKLHSSPSGREVTGVEVDVQGETRMFSGDIVAIAQRCSVRMREPCTKSHSQSCLSTRDFLTGSLGSRIKITPLFILQGSQSDVISQPVA
jgi:choline dehydrogenase-like flavoprotein